MEILYNSIYSFLNSKVSKKLLIGFSELSKILDVKIVTKMSLNLNLIINFLLSIDLYTKARVFCFFVYDVCILNELKRLFVKKI